MKVGVEYWLQHIEQGLLHYTVSYGRNAKRTFASISFRYLNPQDRRRLIHDSTAETPGRPQMLAEI
jgi:hypothetical protein